MTDKKNGTQRLLPEDNGLLAGRILPETLTALGNGLAEIAGRCMIGFSPGSAFAQATAYNVAGAAAAAGGQVVLVADCAPAELGMASVAGDCDCILHIDHSSLHIYAKGLLPLTASQQQALAHTGCNGWLQRSEYGAISDGEGLRLLYPGEILRRLPKTLNYMPEISTGSLRMQTLLTRLFRGGKGRLMTFQLAQDGRRVSLYTEEHGWIFYERLLMLVAEQFFAEGRDVALPFWMPRSVETLAARYQRRVLRYASASDGTDGEARALALRQGITLDGAILCAEVLRICSEKGQAAGSWLAAPSLTHTVRRIISAPVGQIMDGKEIISRCAGSWSLTPTPEGVAAECGSGHALIRPSATGRSMTLWTEAENMETAAELAGQLTALLER